MINNFFKIIHIKYQRFFRFIFFIRYLLVIFIISTAIFFILPNFFNYEKREKSIKDHLLNNYNYELSSYESIKFNSFFIPTLEISDAVLNIKSSSLKLYVKNLKLRPKFKSIYNYNNFQTNKILLKNNNITLNVADLKYFSNHLKQQKNKLNLDNLNIKINNNSDKLIQLEKIKFSNYGYNKNLIQGKIFNQKFKIKINENYSKINFKLINSGFSFVIIFDTNKNNDLLSGIFKTKILDTNLKFNFIYDEEKLEILNSYLRNKNFLLNSQSLVVLKPFLSISSDIIIEDINLKVLKKLDLNKILNSKEVLKKISSKNNFKFLSKKFSGGLIDELDLVVDLAYGRINYQKKISISNNFINCKGNVNLLEEYPLLYFDCLFVSKDTQKFLKEFSIKKKYKIDDFNLKAQGNINILNRKINFSTIITNDDYKATKEDLKYFKSSFERIIFDENFLEIFNFNKIKEFMIEIF
tara:strand:+ start:696 stop:2099 length:1404 start_codon:yes stop_codon:yes gene_type:complete